MLCCVCKYSDESDDDISIVIHSKPLDRPKSSNDVNHADSDGGDDTAAKSLVSDGESESIFKTGSTRRAASAPAGVTSFGRGSMASSTGSNLSEAARAALLAATQRLEMGDIEGDEEVEETETISKKKKKKSKKEARPESTGKKSKKRSKSTGLSSDDDDG
jgi:hypothetical protein